MATASSSFYGLLCLAKTPDGASAPAHLPEIHLNVWEKAEAVYLDIGLMLDINEPASSFELLFPWLPTDSALAVEDLAEKITSHTAVPAIFNESWSITQHSNSIGAVVSDTNTGAVHFAIVDIDNAWSEQPYGSNATALSLDIPALQRKASTLSSNAPKMYVRFRVSPVPKDFYCVGIDQKDKGFLSSWQRTEIIDFRLNVRRGVPPGLEKNIGGRFVEFAKVHLFLMRAREQDIVFEDKLFKACRSLEDEAFWAGYSVQSADDVKKAIGYQWSDKRKDSNGPPVREFSILARFKVVEFGVRSFLVYALLVGALGNGLWDFASWGFDKVSGVSSKSTVGSAAEFSEPPGVTRRVLEADASQKETK